MILESDHHTVFSAELVAEKVESGVTFRLFSNRVFHVNVPRFYKISKAIVDSGYAFLDENGGGKFYNIYQFHSFADVEPEIREWAADSEGNHYTHSDAIVIGSLSQKIITDFYLRYNKPIKPTRIFYSLPKAIEWTIGQM